MVIDVSRLHEHAQDPAWVVFDCRHDLFDTQRGARLYAEGHVPGAHFAPIDTALSGRKTGTNGRHPLPAADDFAAFLNRHGVTPDVQIVAYDDVGGQYASRLWWLARWIGLTRVAVLDGGLPKWIAGGLPLTPEVPRPRGGGTVLARPDSAGHLDAGAVQAGIEARRCLVIDARAPERYRGEVEPIDAVAGRIPSALNRFFKLNLNPDLTLRPPGELRREFESMLGSWKPEQVVHQCGSGVTACMNLLAMEHAGLSGSRLHAGSWSEWIADPSRPIARG
jgi:thiosulfate/3-mercaptopyruvate sulfurtransferase